MYLSYPNANISDSTILQFGDYVFLNASNNGVTPLDGFKQFLANVSSSTKINFAEGCKLWSNDQSGFDEAVNAAKSSDVAIVMVCLHPPSLL
jgi:beta-glucosidase